MAEGKEGRNRFPPSCRVDWSDGECGEGICYCARFPYLTQSIELSLVRKEIITEMLSIPSLKSSPMDHKMNLGCSASQI